MLIMQSISFVLLLTIAWSEAQHESYQRDDDIPIATTDGLRYILVYLPDYFDNYVYNNRRRNHYSDNYDNRGRHRYPEGYNYVRDDEVPDQRRPRYDPEYRSRKDEPRYRRRHEAPAEYRRRTVQRWDGREAPRQVIINNDVSNELEYKPVLLEQTQERRQRLHQPKRNMGQLVFEDCMDNMKKKHRGMTDAAMTNGCKWYSKWGEQMHKPAPKKMSKSTMDWFNSLGSRSRSRKKH